VPVDIRIICATNQDIEQMIGQNQFREDLYYRINTIEIVSPPLRERKGDILLLANRFLDEFSRKHGRVDRYFSTRYNKHLLKQNWPGNIRQLKNYIERAVILSESPVIVPDESAPVDPNGPISDVVSSTLSDFQKDILLDTLEKNGGNISQTAMELGVARSTVYNKLVKYGFQTKRNDGKKSVL
jgi:two-component system response regulator HydG